MQKQARQLNIESNSETFLEAVRCYWMPRLLQKIEQNSVASSSVLADSTNQSSNSIFPCGSSSSSPPLIYNSNHPSENSTSETSQSFFPGDFTSFSPQQQQQQLGISQQATSSHVYGSTLHSSQIPNDTYYVDCCGYDMEGFNLPPMTEIGSYDMSSTECQMAEANWVPNDTSDALWNMDDIWQLRV